MISKFAVSKVRQLVELCAEQRRRCRRVNMHDFRNACNSWEIGRQEAYAALRGLDRAEDLPPDDDARGGRRNHRYCHHAGDLSLQSLPPCGE